MRYLAKEKELIEKTKHEIQLIIDNQLKELIRWDPDRKFIELELEICRKLNEIGAKLLESLIPHIYGDGYIGPRRDINIDSDYVEERTSYRCESRKKSRGLKTVFGSITLSRAVYSEYYSGGQKAFLDEKLKIEDKRTDPLIKYWTDILGTIAPFEEAADVLNKIRGIKISAKQVENSTEETASMITKLHDQDIREIQLNDKGQVPPANITLNQNAKRTVYLETDGCHINTESDWKECKTFMLFELEKKNENEHRLKNKRYFSTMKDAVEIKRQMKYHLEKYCGKEETNIVCIGDGAKWIWNIMQELFPKKIYHATIVEIVDWYHAIEKIGDIKKEIFADEEKGKAFFKECEEYLMKGNIETIEQILVQLRDKQQLEEKRAFVDAKLTYFISNKEKMRYEKFKERGFCIGSGAIESANKYVVQRRLKLPGMKWKENNANYMAHLRAEYINGDMDKHYGLDSNPLSNSVEVG